MKEKTKPYIKHTKKTLPGLVDDCQHVFSVEVEGRAVTFSKRKGRRSGFASVLSIDGKTTEHFVVSGFWLEAVKAIIKQAKRDFIGEAREHFKPINGKDAEGNPLEVVRCSHCRTQFWTDGETPCPYCNSIEIEFDPEKVPSFADFLTKGGRIEYEPPKTDRFEPYGNQTSDEDGPCEDCEGCGDCKPDPPNRKPPEKRDTVSDEYAWDGEEHLSIIKRMDLSFANPLSGALRPEAPATQHDVFELAEALSKEIQTMTDAFARATEKGKKR